MSEKKSFIVFLDFFSFGLIVLGVFLYLFSALPIGGPLTLTSLYVLGMLISGVTLMIASGYLKLSAGLSEGGFKHSLYMLLGSFAAILALNTIVGRVPKRLLSGSVAATTGVPYQLITELVSIAEETLFRGFLTPWLANRFGFWGGVTTSGLVFGAYHVYAYANDASALFIVTGVGMVLGFAALSTKRLWVTMTAHFVNNFF